jgi:hypothetical protein
MQNAHIVNWNHGLSMVLKKAHFNTCQFNLKQDFTNYAWAIFLIAILRALGSYITSQTYIYLLWDSSDWSMQSSLTIVVFIFSNLIKHFSILLHVSIKSPILLFMNY